jgi:hypothetical protein
MPSMKRHVRSIITCTELMRQISELTIDPSLKDDDVEIVERIESESQTILDMIGDLQGHGSRRTASDRDEDDGCRISAKSRTRTCNGRERWQAQTLIQETKTLSHYYSDEKHLLLDHRSIPRLSRGKYDMHSQHMSNQDRQTFGDDNKSYPLRYRRKHYISQQCTIGSGIAKKFHSPKINEPSPKPPIRRTSMDQLDFFLCGKNDGDHNVKNTTAATSA